VVVEADDDLVVHADLARLRQIVVNLLTNAVRYGKDRILLTARAHEGTAYFQVHDDGPGVQKKYEAVIWERFERGAHRFDSATPGSGIGLPIARALVEAHGGAIHQHRSEVLGGACFEFTLPLPNPAPAPEAPRLLPRQAPAAAAVGSAGRS
jgi:two-component system sensor histidine kinase KdpD